MRSSEHGETDYKPRPGEFKKGATPAKPMEAPLSKRLKTDVVLDLDQRSDRRPDSATLPKRSRTGPIPTIPSVGQFDLEGNIHDQINTREGLKPLPPIDQATLEASRGHILPETAKKANRQRWAITRSQLNRASKKNRNG